MFKEDYISAIGKLAPSEAWKADTLAKMRALEARGADPFAPGAAEEPGPARRRAAPFAVRMRRAALPVAALVMLAVLPMTTLRGCGASGGNMASMAADQSAAYTSISGTGKAGAYDTAAPAAPAAAPEDAPEAQAFSGQDAPSGEAAPQEADGAWPDEAGPDVQDTTRGTPTDRPFGTLAAEELEMASVRFAISDQIALITDAADVAELAALLNGVAVCGQDDSDAKHDGEGVVFTLTLADGTQTEVLVYPPFLVIDGTGYRAEAASCEALGRYARRLLEAPPAAP